MKRTAALFPGLLLFATGALGECPSPSGKNNILLYFPTADDPDFPKVAWTSDDGTKTYCFTGAGAFDIAPLGVTTKTTTDLMNAIVNAVQHDYCEFDVQVTSTRDKCCGTSPCMSCAAKTDTVLCAVGTDVPSAVWWCGPPPAPLLSLYGLADQYSNLARVWGGSYSANCVGLVPTPTFADLVNAISGVVSHEVGHKYGLWHSHASAEPGEDTKKHIMSDTSCLVDSSCWGSTEPCIATCMHETAKCDSDCGGNCCDDPSTTATYPAGDCCVDCPDRAKDRHFGDLSYGVLATTLGLCTTTLDNWDFTNANPMPADAMEIEVWTEDTKLERTWYYSEANSPWTEPQPDTAPFGTGDIGGVTYNKFLVQWTTPNPAYMPTPGVVAPGVKFHTGIALKSTSTPAKPIIVAKVTLKSGGSPLALSPRMIGYDSGTLLSTSSGTIDLSLGFVNPDPEASEICVSDVTVRFLPRMAAIETMTSDMELEPLTREGLPIPVLGTLSFPDEFCIEGAGSSGIRIAGLADPRFLDDVIAVTGGGDVGEGDPRLDPPEFERIVGLFPSIYTYVTAKVRDPLTSQESRLFYQFAGMKPDCNQNGIDDLLEIEEDGVQDSNMNGLPDECETSSFQRGDANGDTELNITDAVTILNFLFLGGAPIQCMDAADAGDAGTVNITSAVYLLNHLFLGGPAPPLPHPACGLDPTGDVLGCNIHPCP